MSLNGQPILALIPARGGSKSVPNKNMRLIKGVPLIGYTLKAAFKSRYITNVYVSSDDDAVISYAKENNANLIRRPMELCTDTSTANDVVGHFLDFVSKKYEGQDPYVIYLQPTSPLRNESHIDSAFDKMKKKRVNKLISVLKMEVSIYKSFELDEKGFLQSLYDEKTTNKSRQTLPQVFLPNGAIYVFQRSDFFSNDGLPSNGSCPYYMDALDSIDIDSEEDLFILESVLTQRAQLKMQDSDKTL